RALSSLQLGSRNAPIRVPIALTGCVHDVGRQGRWRSLAIPRALLLQVRQVIAQRLFVEARLAAARLIAVGGPEARGVGRQDLVDDDEIAVRCGPKLELRVGDDDPALRGVVAARLVQRQTGATEPLRGEAPEALDDVVEGDVLVVPLF